jgi:streptogramin lyase
MMLLVPVLAQAQLSGVVSSAEEGTMEGVLVNAKRAGANKTVTVVTDDKGRYQFPADRLEAGQYTLSIRAAGYDMARRAIVDVAAGSAAPADLKLIKTHDLASQLTNAETQINMTSPMNIGVDGKVWAQNNGFAGVHRIDLATNQWETWEPYKAAPQGHNIYDVISDSKNNGWFTNIGRNHIGRIDAQTGDVKIFETPTKSSGPRRGKMDAEDRIWFGQYRGNRIAMLDTRRMAFKEWLVPTPWSGPYDVDIDKNGEAWTGSMLNDRIARLNTQSGEIVEYLLPRSTNVRRVFVENYGPRTTFWVGSNHGASIIKLEPLD